MSPTPPAERPSASVGRGALSPAEAAEWLGISRSTFYAEVFGELRVAKLGRRTLIPLRELERWLERHAARPIDR